MVFFEAKAYLLLIFLLSQKCQFTLGQNRIIGGYETVISKFPHLVRLNIPRKNDNLTNICGASIISPEWLVTAAHCVQDPESDFNKTYVIAGSTNVIKLDSTGSVHKVIEIVKHELFKGLADRMDFRADIAVLKVSPPFNYSKVVQPIKLPEKGKYLKTIIGTVAGWGYTQFGGSSPAKLRYLIVPKINTAFCRLKLDIAGATLAKGEICYGINGLLIIKDVCNGDSGGSLINSDKILIGIVSWGVNCGTRGFPGVYTEAAYFRDWIKEKTGI